VVGASGRLTSICQSIIGLYAGQIKDVTPAPSEPNEGKLAVLQIRVCSMADPEGIYNWHRLDDRITTSGQPTEE